MQEASKETQLAQQVRNNISLMEEQEYPTNLIIEKRHIIDFDQGATRKGGQLQYSHHATFHGIPCYFNVETEGFTGSGKFNCLLLDVLIFIGRFIPGIGAATSIVIGAELKKDNLYH
jgi:hypothetical protein